MDVYVPCLSKASSPVARDRKLVQHNAVAEVLVIRFVVGERAINRFQRVNVGLRIDADRCRHQQQKTHPLHRDYRPVRPMNQCKAKQSYDSLVFFFSTGLQRRPAGPSTYRGVVTEIRLDDRGHVICVRLGDHSILSQFQAASSNLAAKRATLPSHTHSNP